MALLVAPAGWGWDDRRLSVPLVVDERTIPYPEFAIYVMPGQKFHLHFRDALLGGTIDFLGVTRPVGQEMLQAPAEPGLYPLHVTNAASGERAQLNVFVMVPADAVDEQGVLNGYRIGSYPLQPFRKLDIYLPPKGFIELTSDNARTRVSPNFTLQQFASKQEGEYPKYLVLRANLLLKLENILATLNRSGRKTGGLVIMSGYRTPWYNRTIGNVPYSRHLWGGAADLYIDEHPVDGRMDDLNGDGVSNREDARWLAAFINEMSMRGDFGPRVGGLGMYGASSAHGPFVHIDVRGQRARW
jgi:hypothetical protein